jgi:hypothetical protein
MVRTVDPETKDEPVGDHDGFSVVDTITRCRIEAEDARRERLEINRRNRNVYFGRQDWSHKQRGQSTEFLPKTATSVEQMTSFIKRGLVQFGDWFSVDLDRSMERLVDGSQIRSLMMCFLRNLWSGNNTQTSIDIVISDSVKNGLLESLMILKVHGGMMPTRAYKYENGELTWVEGEEWRLRIDLVRPEDYYPDPSGAGLYEVHRVERDLHEVVDAAEMGVYDMAVIKQLIDVDFTRPEDEERSDEDRNQAQTTEPSFRKKIVLDEFWGTLLNSDGTVAHRNCVATVANDRFLIRKPEPNPFWHQESPFVVAPLVRVPWSVWHRALYDQAASLNLSLNEMFNLMLDGGIAAVWGVKQIRLEDLEDPGQVAGGVQQGDTLAVKQTLPHNAKVMERVDTGNVPQDAMAIFEFVNREYTQSALTNEIKLGSLPGKQVRATEVVEATQSQAITLDGIVADIENSLITNVLRKSWLTILQNADDIPPETMRSVADNQAAHLIMRAPPEERFALFGGTCSFKVNGLSATMSKALDFQKIMAAFQAISTNPFLLQKAIERFSANKMISKILHSLNIDPLDLEKDQAEQAAAATEAANTGAAASITDGTQGASAAGAQGAEGAPVGGGSGVPAQINQGANPVSGMVPNG